MRMIKIFDSADYEPHWTKFKRDSARAIIFIGDKLLMVRSKKYGEYKFPGGGIDLNETHTEALIREVMEETGYSLLPEIPWTLRDLTVLQELKQNQMKG